ncbi:MAG: C10 family peptidase [Paramuribaculum sp.]|nr:C10 family peptidase [Paramuribaculum sp.]
MKSFKSQIHYILVFVFICFTGVLNAQTISRDEALTKAKQFINANSPATRSANDAQYEAVDIAQHLYVFNMSNGGYVIVSSEPTSESIIGYSLSGKIDKNNIPDNMRVMLQGYEKEIKASINNPQPLSRSVDAKPVYKTPIAPIVKVKWNQGDPYNMFCPKIDGQRPWTGCVPTAMAQIMGHYKWPKKGHGLLIHDGERINGQCIGLDTINLDTTPIDWKNMCNTYTGRETQAQKEAVAMLMKMCGYACGVSYGLSSSGAGGGTPRSALKYYFYYKVNRINSGSFCGDYVAMHNFFYNTLKEGKPIICDVSGIGNDGHGVVVDGCDKNGFLHINFGWAGSYDGYFQMNATKHVGYTFGTFNYIIVAEPDYEMKGEDNLDGFSTSTFSITDKNGINNYSEENAENDQFF